MVTLIRVEAEGPALPNVTRDLDEVEAAFKKKTSRDLRVHDEHYERVHDTLFKGRRVYRMGEKESRTGVLVDFGGTGTTTFTAAA